MSLEITSADRCDQCGCQAWVKVWVAAEFASELLLCGHHFAQHEARLTQLGATWVDDRGQLDPKPVSL